MTVRLMWNDCVFLWDKFMMTDLLKTTKNDNIASNEMKFLWDFYEITIWWLEDDYDKMFLRCFYAGILNMKLCSCELQ